MRCAKYDSYLDDDRLTFLDGPCGDPDCAFCRDRPPEPRDCAGAPCSDCRYLRVFWGDKRLVTIYKEILKHPEAKYMLEPFYERSKYDARYGRLRLVCRHTGEETIFDAGYGQRFPKNPSRPEYGQAKEDRPFSARQAQVWWADYQAELPDDARRPARRHLLPPIDEWDI